MRRGIPDPRSRYMWCMALPGGNGMVFYDRAIE